MDIKELYKWLDKHNYKCISQPESKNKKIFTNKKDKIKIHVEICE